MNLVSSSNSSASIQKAEPHLSKRKISSQPPSKKGVSFMARVKNPLFLKWRSKHGGTVGYAFRTVAAMRGHFPCRPKTSAPSFAYGHALRETLSSWRALSIEDQNAWNTFASSHSRTDKYGEAIYWSGFNWFVCLNGVRFWLSRSPLLLPPPSPIPSYNPTITIFGGSGLVSILFVPDPLPNSDQFINTARSLNHGESVSKGPNFLTKWQTFTEGECNPATLAYTSEFSQGGFNHFFDIQSYDKYGLSSGKQRYLYST